MLLQLIVHKDKSNPAHPQKLSRYIDCTHSPALEHAVMAVSKLIVLGSVPRHTPSRRMQRAYCQLPLFSQALIAVLHAMTSESIPWLVRPSTNPIAISHFALF